MDTFPSAKAKRVFSALERIGWKTVRTTGSPKVLSHSDYPNYVFSFHDNEEIGPVMLKRISKHTGLKPEDL